MKPLLLALAAAASTTAASLHVPEGFKVEQATPANTLRFPMFAAVADEGRLFVTESSGGDLYEELKTQHRGCRISVMTDADGDGRYESSKVFYDNLVPSMGIAWRDNKVYVADPPNILALEDTDNDGRADKSTVVLSGFGHTDNGSLHGLTFGPDGWLYFTMGSPDGFKLQRADGKFVEGKNGALLRCKPDGSDAELICRGFENLVEIVFMPNGEIIGTDNWFSLPREGVRDALVHLVRGAVYPLNAYQKFETDLFFSGELLPAIQMYPAVAFSGLMRHSGKNVPTELKDNLFSAQHNTRKIGRHRLSRTAETFRTEDEDFLATDDPDFHPSDVLEDRDGSILVVDTGSWYVHHCPTGRIRKTAAPGGIYRIKYSGSGFMSHLAASANTNKNDGAFAHHKFIYDLHKNADRATLLQLLEDSDPNKRRAALVVLDQSPHNALPMEAAFLALKSSNESLRRAALDSFRRHPDWMPRAIDFTKEQLGRDPIDTPLTEMMMDEADVRRAVRAAVGDENKPTETRVALLDIAAKLPSAERKLWRETLDKILASENPKLIAAALRVQASSPEVLSAVGAKESLPSAVRLEALRQLPAISRFRDSQSFDFLCASLAKTNTPAIRLAAAGLLNSFFDVAQKQRLAAITKDDLLIGPSKSSTADQQKTLDELAPLIGGGDENRGQQLFLGKGSCTACHRVGKTGGVIGPDLTRVGTIRTGRDLLESIAFPSATFAQGYEPLRVETRSGEVISGMRARQLDDSFVLRDASGAETRLREEEIKRVERGEVSIMPEGLLNSLTHEEIRDLLAYLQKLK